MGYVTTHGGVFVDRTDGSSVYLPEAGLPVPVDAVPSHIEHLLNVVGLIKDDGVNNAAASDVPAKSAPKADWVDFAVSQGVAQEDAEASTKEQLVEQFGG